MILTTQAFKRTDGSKRQELIPIEHKRRGLYPHTTFYKLFTEEGTFFGKKVGHKKVTNERIFLYEITHERIVPFLGEDEEYGFIFPFIEGTTLEKVKWKNIENRKDVLEQLEAFYDFLKGTETSLGNLLASVDTHKNNFIMQVENNNVTNWWFVDLEKIPKNFTERNLGQLRSYKGYFGL